MSKSYGQIAFEAYGDAASWLTYDKKPMPSWNDLYATEVGSETQRRWEVAAEAAILAKMNDNHSMWQG